MKNSKDFTAAVLLFGLVTALLMQPATANPKDSFTVHFENPVLVQGNRLDPGSYEIQCSLASPEAVVKIFKAGKVIVEAQGKWVEKGIKAKDTIIVTEQDAAGKILKEIQLKGKTQAIVLE